MKRIMLPLVASLLASLFAFYSPSLAELTLLTPATEHQFCRVAADAPGRWTVLDAASVPRETLLDGTSCVFVGRAGVYAVLHWPADGAPVEFLAVLISPAEPVPIPPPGPTPVPPPNPPVPTPRQLGWITVLEESGDRTVEQGRLYQSDVLWTWMAKRRVSFRVLDQDLKDETDKPSAVAQAFLKARGEVALPALFLDSDSNPSNGVVWVGSVPGDVDGLMKLLRQHGGE